MAYFTSFIVKRLRLFFFTNYVSDMKCTIKTSYFPCHPKYTQTHRFCKYWFLIIAASEYVYKYYDPKAEHKNTIDVSF